MGKKVIHSFDKETGISEIIIWDKGHRFVGRAKVHEDDKDIASELTGATIAEARAEARRFRFKASATKKLIDALKRQLAHLERVYSEQKAIAEDCERFTKEYIEDKEIFAKKFRKHKKIVAAGE